MIQVWASKTDIMMEAFIFTHILKQCNYGYEYHEPREGLVCFLPVLKMYVSIIIQLVFMKM